MTPGILAAQKAEIGKIVVQNQPKANSSGETLSGNKSTPKQDWWSGPGDRVLA
jgi:hypothetical protein